MKAFKVTFRTQFSSSSGSTGYTNPVKTEVAAVIAVDSTSVETIVRDALGGGEHLVSIDLIERVADRVLPRGVVVS